MYTHKRSANKPEFLRRNHIETQFLKNHIITLADKGSAEYVIDLNFSIVAHELSFEK